MPYPSQESPQTPTPKPPSFEPLTEKQVLLVNVVEQSFWEFGRIPTTDKLQELSGFTTQTIKKYFTLANFRAALLSRGIDLDAHTSEHLLTEKQLLVANMLLNLHDKRTEREKCEAAGITTQQLNAWRRDTKFAAYLQKRAESLFASSDPDAFKALVQSVKANDTQAIKLYMEMRGRYTPKSQVDVSVEQVLVTVVEVVSRHVKDPLTLQAIARDLQGISSSSSPQLPPPDLGVAV